MINKILKYAGKFKWLTLLATIMVIIAVVAQILPYIYVWQLITPLIEGKTLETSFIVSKIIAVAICLCLNVLLYIGGLGFSHIAAFNTLCNLRLAIQNKMEKLPLGIIHDKGIGRLKKTIVDDVESMELLLAHAIPEGLGNMLVPIGVIIAMFFVDWKLALLSLFALPVGVFAMSMMMKQGFSKMNAYYAAAQKMNNTIIEYINGMEVVKVFNKDSDSYKRYRTDVESYRDYTIDWYKCCWPWMAVYSSIFACFTILTLPLGGIFALNGITTLPNLIFILCLSFGLGGPILKAMHFVPNLVQIARKVDEIEKTVEAEPLKSKGNIFKGTNHTVEYKNVSFAYETADVAKNVNLIIQEGKTTALVGESGSGKSTLAKLLVHYYDIHNGSITIGNQDITDMSLEALNNQVSFVSQDQFLFNTSIYDNIKIGNPNATEAEVLVAAQKAQCNEFIERLPNGIHSLAGDCGNQLSGGERQRVSLARAILKNAPVVVLDEATAFADPENEEKMKQAINEVVKGKTLLVIAHRLASIKDSDCIYVMHKGQISGRGTHSQLLQNCELYQRLWKAAEESMEWKVSNVKED